MKMVKKAKNANPFYGNERIFSVFSQNAEFIL